MDDQKFHPPSTDVNRTVNAVHRERIDQQTEGQFTGNRRLTLQDLV